jgi:hypothetical protein
VVRFEGYFGPGRKRRVCSVKDGTGMIRIDRGVMRMDRLGLGRARVGR